MFLIQQPIRGVPIVIFHHGNQPYLRAVIRHNKQFGTVVLIGDESNGFARCTHVNYKRLGTPQLDEFNANFINYANSRKDAQLVCFQRLFYIRRWMELQGLREIVHLDSDCLLQRPLPEMFPNKQVAYSYRSGCDTMAASIHVSFLTYDFLVAYERMCRDIYVTKTHLHLIEDHWRLYRESGKPGGVCDMTIYYLLTKEMPVHALMDLQPDGSTFDDNINDSNGFAGPDTFAMENGMKVIRKRDGIVEAKCVDGTYVRLNNLHYQGPAKKYIV